MIVAVAVAASTVACDSLLISFLFLFAFSLVSLFSFSNFVSFLRDCDYVKSIFTI